MEPGTLPFEPEVYAQSHSIFTTSIYHVGLDLVCGCSLYIMLIREACTMSILVSCVRGYNVLNPLLSIAEGGYQPERGVSAWDDNWVWCILLSMSTLTTTYFLFVENRYLYEECNTHVFTLKTHQCSCEGRSAWDDMCDHWDALRYQWSRNFGV